MNFFYPHSIDALRFVHRELLEKLQEQTKALKETKDCLNEIVYEIDERTKNG